MGIPVNDKCMLLRVGAESSAYLDNVVGVVITWKITSKREGEKRELTWVWHSDIDVSVQINLLLFILNHSLARMSLSYQGCGQVKLQICGGSFVEKPQAQFQLKKTTRELQMESQMRSLQRWQTIAFNVICAPAFQSKEVFTTPGMNWMPNKNEYYEVG